MKQSSGIHCCVIKFYLYHELNYIKYNTTYEPHCKAGMKTCSVNAATKGFIQKKTVSFSGYNPKNYRFYTSFSGYNPKNY